MAATPDDGADPAGSESYVTHTVNLADAGAARPLLVRLREHRRSHRAQILGEGAAQDETGGFIWAASHVLARWLQLAEAPPLDGARVLELGAGCGLVGLAVAASGRAASVALTDLHAATLANLRRNARLNEAAAGWRPPAVGALDWGAPATWPPAGSVDLALGADLIYDDGMAAGLAPVLAHALRRGGEFVHVHPERGRVGPDELAPALAASGFELAHDGLVPPEALRCNATDGSVGADAGKDLHSMWHVFNEVRAKRYVVQRFRRLGDG
jgi:predicted nicotinamide N-methyase